MAKRKSTYFTCYDNQLLRTVERDQDISKAHFGLELLCFFFCRHKNSLDEIEVFTAVAMKDMET
jgi:hypothetical protein